MKLSAPSGCSATWRLYRHCCCRYGWYPIIVLPIVTVGSFLSLYSTAGCEFVHVDIGFTPLNDGWNRSTGEFGLLFHQTGMTHENQYRDRFHHGCEWYPQEFTYHFVDADRTWKMARIMAIISMFSSVIAAIFVLLFVISPIPISFFWPGVVLPAVLVSFIAEGSKFLIFDTAMCRNNIWASNEGEYITNHRVEDCKMGHTAYAAIAAVIVHFISLSFVCLKAPERRKLDDDYGIKDGNNLSPGARKGDLDIEEATNGNSVASARSCRSGRSGRSGKSIGYKWRPDSPPPGRRRNRGFSGRGGVGFLDEVALESNNSMNTATTGLQEDIDPFDEPGKSSSIRETELKSSHEKELEKERAKKAALGVDSDFFGENNSGAVEGGESNLLVRTFSGMLATKSLSEYLLPSPIASCLSNEASNSATDPEAPTNNNATGSAPSPINTAAAGDVTITSDTGSDVNIETAKASLADPMKEVANCINPNVPSLDQEGATSATAGNNAISAAVLSPRNAVASAVATVNCVRSPNDTTTTTTGNAPGATSIHMKGPRTLAEKERARDDLVNIMDNVDSAVKLPNPNLFDDLNVGLCRSPKEGDDHPWIPRNLTC